MNTSQSGWWGSWQCYARVNYYFRNKVKKQHEHSWKCQPIPGANPYLPVHTPPPPIEFRAKAEQEQEREKKNKMTTKMTQKRELKFFCTSYDFFMTETGALMQPMEFRARLVAKEKRRQHKKEFKCFWNIFSIFSLVKSFTPARDRRRCRLAGGTYCFLNLKFLSFGWQTGQFSKLRHLAENWIFCQIAEIFVSKRSPTLASCCWRQAQMRCRWRRRRAASCWRRRRVTSCWRRRRATSPWRQRRATSCWSRRRAASPWRQRRVAW